MTKLSMGKERIFPEHERMFMRNAWLFLSLGNILGGVWAYEALGWGGYWAWDPLETASLLPWIAVTAYFHARPIRKLLGRGIEITTVTSFLLVLFAALVTRGGIVQTIHGFAAGPTQIGYALLTVMVMIGVAMLFLVLAFKGKRRRRKRYYLKPEISLETLYFLAFVSLILITIVCFVGVLRNFKVEQYNTLTFPLTIVFIFAATGCVLTTYLKPSQIGTLWIASLAAGVGSLAMGITGNRLADFGLPIVAASLMAVVYSIYRDFAAVRRKMLVFGKVCQRFLHVGLLITLIGVLLSSTLAPALPTRVFLFLGERSQVEGTNFALELEDSNAQGWGEVVSPHRTEYFEGEIHLAVYEAGRLVGRGTISMVNDPRWGWYSSVYVHRFPTIDLYVHGISPDLVFLSEDLTLIVATQVDVFVNPYVNIVWIGCALMFVSVIPLIKQSIDRIKG
jgi:cytochrome c biogenesis factor